MGHKSKDAIQVLLEGQPSMSNLRIQELEELGFEWDSYRPPGKDRLSELADYRKIKGTAMFLQTTRKR
jgi:hypothetical protein